MLLKGQQVLGKPITTEYGERIIDDIAGIAIDPYSSQLLGFYFNSYSLFSKQVIPFRSVKVLTPTSVKVYSTSDLLPASHIISKASLQIDTNLQFKRIYSPDGLLLGYLYDTLFDAKTGQVVSYEMIVGSNIQNRWQIQSPHFMKITPKSIILTEEASKYIRSGNSESENKIVPTNSDSTEKPSLFTRIQQTLKLPTP